MRIIGYLDAGTGSLIASVVVGGAASLAVFIKMFGLRIAAVFSPKKRERLAAIRAAGTGAEADAPDAQAAEESV